jgi:hypothetical protein
MGTTPLELCIALGLVAMGASAPAQTSPTGATEIPNQPQSLLPASPTFKAERIFPDANSTPAVQLLRDFKDSDVKFDLQSLMDTLRDRRHEGWVFAVYPDPKTSQPLIGAGFSLDLRAREHAQLDTLNPHPFLEPSSAELWQAAGMEPERLEAILDQFHGHMKMWSKRTYRKKINTLAPEISDEEATLLLRVAAIQAIYNAKAYCRNFDQLTAPQQMALSQLVYQMGVNLEEFSQFLSLINTQPAHQVAMVDAAEQSSPAPAPDYWKAVQQSLIQSQWARLYRTRAISVIAMLDPEYVENPVGAERHVSAILHPVVRHRHRGRAAGSPRLASNISNRTRATGPKTVRNHAKKTA